MTYPQITQQEVEALFTLACIPVINIKPLPDGYGYSPDDSRYYEQPPRCAWWFVKTTLGWIEIGWRKRVLVIDWTDTPIRKIITTDDTTKSEHMVHAWTDTSALNYLKTLGKELADYKVAPVVVPALPPGQAVLTEAASLPTGVGIFLVRRYSSLPGDKQGMDVTTWVATRVEESNNWSGRLETPGGRLEAGEIPIQAARRELMEETGLDIDYARIMPFYGAAIGVQPWNGKKYQTYWFYVELRPSDPLPVNQELAKRTEWREESLVELCEHQAMVALPNLVEAAQALRELLLG